MAFVSVQGLKGKVFVPEAEPEATGEHRCPDCFSCQRCSKVRCDLCSKERECIKGEK